MPHNNPFIYGNPVAPAKLLGRKRELRQIAGRIYTGQSSIITGLPRSGKTSVLEYLNAPEKRAELYGDKADKLIFSYWDACTCSPEFTQAQFWEYVLKPIQERIAPQNTNSPLDKAYETCQANDFEPYELEKLIAEIKKANCKLLILIDEFDQILDSSFSLYTPDFLGGLRSQVQRGKGALVLVITANISRSQLNEETRHFRKSETGSDYLNHLEEIVLGALSNSEIDELLHQGDIHFTDDDRRFIKDIAGGYPYLLEVAASILWEIYEEKKVLINPHQHVKRELYLKVADTLNAIWKSWPQLMIKEHFTSLQKVVISVALAEVKKWKINFKKQGINIDHITKRFNGKEAELRQLERYGFLIKDTAILGGWRIYPKIFLPFSIQKLEGYDDLKDLVVQKFFESS